MGERDGVAVQCHTCKGTGEHLHKYLEFTGKKSKSGIQKVVLFNPGIALGSGPEYGGISYEDWMKNPVFGLGTESRGITCPAWWYGLDGSHDQPDWIECRVGVRAGASYTSCTSFDRREKCWEKFDREIRSGKIK
jgi:hypothetical protein